VVRSPLRAHRLAPISPSTSVSISNCNTASATARRKSLSPAFSSSSANTNLSSVIGPLALQVEVLQLHLSRLSRWPPQLHRSPTLRIAPKNSTTSVDANREPRPDGHVPKLQPVQSFASAPAI